MMLKDGMKRLNMGIDIGGCGRNGLMLDVVVLGKLVKRMGEKVWGIVCGDEWFGVWSELLGC